MDANENPATGDGGASGDRLELASFDGTRNSHSLTLVQQESDLAVRWLARRFALRLSVAAIISAAIGLGAEGGAS